MDSEAAVNGNASVIVLRAYGKAILWAPGHGRFFANLDEGCAKQDLESRLDGFWAIKKPITSKEAGR